MVDLYNPVDTFMIHRGLSSPGKGSVHKGGCSPISVGRAVVGNHPDKGKACSIVRMYTVSPRYA